MIRTLPDHDRNRSRNKPLRTVRPDLYHASHGDDGMSCVTATHFARGTMLDLLTHLAVALEAVVVPQDGAALIFHEDQRRHLQRNFRHTQSSSHPQMARCRPPSKRTEHVHPGPTGAW